MIEAYEIWYSTAGESVSIEGNRHILSITSEELERAKRAIRKVFTKRENYGGRERYSKGNVLFEIDERESVRLRYELKVFAHSEEELMQVIEEELGLPYRDLEGTTLVGARIPDSVRRAFEKVKKY